MDEVAALPGCEDAQAEARQLLLPDEMLLDGRLGLIDCTLGLEHDELSLTMLYSYFGEQFHGSVGSLRDSTSSHIALALSSAQKEAVAEFVRVGSKGKGRAFKSGRPPATFKRHLLMAASLTAQARTVQAAELLAVARRDRIQLADLPVALRPKTLAEAYLIQDALAGLLGPIGGWKVGAAPGGGILVAPIANAFIHTQFAAPVVPAPARLEVEFAITLATDLPGRAAPYRAADVAPAIGDAHIIIEVLGHRFVAQDAVSALTYLADGNGNASVIVGDAIADWRSLDLAKLDVALSVDGMARGRRGQGDGIDGLLDLLTSLANHAAHHAGGLRAKQVVITGARIGPVIVVEGDVEGSVNGTFKVKARVG